MALPFLYEVDLNQHWALYNALKFWTLYDLTEDEVKLLVLTFSDNELKLTKVCRKGDSTWDSILSPENNTLFLNEANKAKYSDVTAYPQFENKGDESVDTNIFKIVKVKLPRLHSRYERRISCKIIGPQHKTFATQTFDLSEGGLSFIEVIPDWVAGYFLISVDNQFEVLCSVVEDQKERTRVQIVSEETEPQFINYKAWLLTL